MTEPVSETPTETATCGSADGGYETKDSETASGTLTWTLMSPTTYTEVTGVEKADSKLSVVHSGEVLDTEKSASKPEAKPAKKHPKPEPNKGPFKTSRFIGTPIGVAYRINVLLCFCLVWL